MPTLFTIDANASRRQNQESPRKIIAGTLVSDASGGSAAGQIPASLFGLTVIEEVLPLVQNNNGAIVTASPAYDGKSLLAKAAGSAAPAVIPAGTYSCTVKGW